MPIKDFFYVKTIADEKSITKAAEKLYIAQPSLTQHVRRIEQNLGHALFVRTTNGTFLTQIGKQYYQTASQILNLYQVFLDRKMQFQMQHP